MLHHVHVIAPPSIPARGTPSAHGASAHRSSGVGAPRVPRAVGPQDDLDELLVLARAALHDVLSVEHAFIFLYDAPRNELWTRFMVPGRKAPEEGSAR